MHLICTGMPFKLACVPKNMLNRSTEESAAQLDALSRMGMVVCSPRTETLSLARCLHLFSDPPRAFCISARAGSTLQPPCVLS